MAANKQEQKISAKWIRMKNENALKTSKNLRNDKFDIEIHTIFITERFTLTAYLKLI